MELCFKLDENWEVLPKLINAVIDITQSWIKDDNKSNPLNISMEFRITKNSGALMSPAFSQDDDNSYYLWLEVLGTQAYPNWWAYAQQIRDAWLNIDPTAKPHWCKWYEPDGEDSWKTLISNNFANQIQEFSKYVKSKDPEGRFTTQFWKNILKIQ